MVTFCLPLLEAQEFSPLLSVDVDKLLRVKLSQASGRRSLPVPQHLSAQSLWQLTTLALIPTTLLAPIHGLVLESDKFL